MEADGVLKSWAIPKGPTFDRRERRLAMHVEDHPLDYRDFEGIIPKGNYGAGEVIVWDYGTYTLAEGTDPTAEIGRGKIKFVLNGKKLHGEFTLVRIRGRESDGDPWLLVKDDDEYVDPSWRIDDHPESAKTGKTLADVASDPRAPHWQSHRPPSAAPAAKKPAARKREKMPDVSSPMLATLVDEPFDDPEWLFEIKWDGYRALCKVDEKGRVALTSRHGLDFLKQFPELEDLGSAFTSLPIFVDGEIVSLDARGRSSFQRLQGSFNRHRPSATSGHGPLTYVVFDILYADGRDMRKQPLEERKTALEGLIRDGRAVMFSKHVVGKGIALYEKAQQQSLEGIIGKRRESRYVERRSREWVKIKALLEQECVIGGYTEPRGSRTGFGALLLGLYEGKKLVYAGHTGTGFDTKTLLAMHAQLRKLESAKCPFAERPKTNTPGHWVKPQLVAQVRFTEWTRDGLMRHPVFLGLRADKNARECVREVPLDTGVVT